MRNMDKFLNNSIRLIYIELERVDMLCKHTDLATDIRIGEPYADVANITHHYLKDIQKHLAKALNELEGYPYLDNETFNNACHTEYSDGTVRD